MKKCNIYIGEIIKQVISEQKISKAELARRLGVKPQSVDYMLTRKSIDTDTLYLLSNILNYDFYDPSNILVVDDSQKVDYKGFVESPYVTIKESVRNRYTIKGWIAEIFDITL